MRERQIRDVPRETRSDKQFLSGRDAFGIRLKIYEATFGNALGKGVFLPMTMPGEMAPFMRIIIF